MNISEICIRRPVMTILLMASFVLAGAFGKPVIKVGLAAAKGRPVVGLVERDDQRDIGD